MSLSCGCEFYNDFQSDSERRARKDHYCGECGKRIEIGEVYNYSAGKTDGTFWDNKTCEKCHDLGLSMQAMGFCWIIGDLIEDHKEYIQDYAPPKIKR